MNSVGIAAASAAFVGIWLGHVAVRRVEAAVARLWPPVVIAVIVGCGLEVVSVLTRSRSGSVAAGIIGITVVWDAIELLRQQRRVKHGHAPANPNNPRHARLLSECPSATTLDLLKRSPAGSPSVVGARGC